MGAWGHMGAHGAHFAGWGSGLGLGGLLQVAVPWSTAGGLVRWRRSTAAVPDCGHWAVVVPHAEHLMRPSMRNTLCRICAYPASEPDCEAGCGPDCQLDHTDCGQDCCAVLLAASGAGAGALSRYAVMRGCTWSAACLAASGATWLAVPDAAAQKVRGLVVAGAPRCSWQEPFSSPFHHPHSSAFLLRTVGPQSAMRPAPRAEQPGRPRAHPNLPTPANMPPSAGRPAPGLLHPPPHRRPPVLRRRSDRPPRAPVWRAAAGPPRAARLRRRVVGAFLGQSNPGTPAL